MEFAKGDRFESLAEVGDAFSRKGESLLLEMPKVVQGVTDGTGFRARQANNWGT